MTIHEQLVTLCRDLGNPQRDLAILGEGNASARLDDETFVVTTSGSELLRVTENELVDVTLSQAASLARDGAEEFDREALNALALHGPKGERRVPSIETLLHALVLERTGCNFVGHTHPTAILGLVCTERGVDSLSAPLFPDEVVVCGPRALVVPYAAPGPALASTLDHALVTHFDEVGSWPKTIMLINHGLLALGETPAEVMAVTTMAEKAARVRLHSLSIGEIRPLTSEQIRSLDTRSDEEFRRRKLIEGA